ncbi:hypothetical protein ILUMI_18511 [Ignelater luminosus]|uniref:Uncharacterized protein n=1 Tax=Ignelater luminosus TaxID=2038154 RepID=A0A8K0CP16_IGNLU|nr:hypothetical protein ILUMI_18511 [Ignelater luminosus]
MADQGNSTSSNKKFYPRYTTLQKTKRDCYSVQESFRITATCAESNFQDVSNHTVSRLLLHLSEVIQHLNSEERNTLTLMYNLQWRTDTKSTMRGYICGTTSKEFNDLSKRKDINEDSLQFGLSTLHARIRLFEGLLHVAYKLPVKKWQLRNKNDKQIVQQKKFEIQEEFRTQLGLIVDVPKAGFDNSNDGNTKTVEMLLPADTLTEAVLSNDENLAEAAEESSDEPWMSSPDE